MLQLSTVVDGQGQLLEGMGCADLGDKVFEVGVAGRLVREGERLLPDGREHVRDGVPLERQLAPQPHIQTHSSCPDIHLTHVNHCCGACEAVASLNAPKKHIVLRWTATHTDTLQLPRHPPDPHVNLSATAVALVRVLHVKMPPRLCYDGQKNSYHAILCAHIMADMRANL